MNADSRLRLRRYITTFVKSLELDLGVGLYIYIRKITTTKCLQIVSAFEIFFKI